MDLMELIARWVEELSVHLGRPADEIRQRGLSAYDFPRTELEIVFADGSHITFRYAFFVVSAKRKLVAVFTEHCGYFEFPMNGLRIETLQRQAWWSGDDTLNENT